MKIRARKRVAVVITARPSYSRFKSALRAIKKHENLDLELIVSASALIDKYGKAVDLIEKDGFTTKYKVYNLIDGSAPSLMAKTTGLGILELSTVFENMQPDIVITIADRYETMATAIAASYMNIPLVHIQGGEVTGNIDEKVRHAITKLADFHLVANEDAATRVKRLGESTNRIVITGCPSIDLAREARDDSYMDFDLYKEYGGVGAKPRIEEDFIVVLQHPVTTEYGAARKQINETLEAVSKLGIPAFWFWPNIDAGADETSKGLRSYRERYPESRIHFFKNMEGKDFLRLLLKSRALIGNSSVGIRECAFLGVPVVNIGSRQDGRIRGENVIDVDYDSKSIQVALKKQLATRKYPEVQIYGDGYAGERVASALYESDLTINKRIIY